MDLFKIADTWMREDFGFAVATIIESKGSTPRHHAKMLIREDKTLHGTIGGGPGEFLVIEDALEALRTSQNTIKDYIFDKSVPGGLPTQCGGSMKVLIEVFPRKKRMILIGAGYVNQAVLDIGCKLGYRCIVIDDRPEYATEELLPQADTIYAADEIEVAIARIELTSDDICVIATKDCDYEALRQVVQVDFRYLGMIGSKRKVKKIFEQLLAEGVKQSQLDRVHAPIGLDIGAELPYEIALSITSEILTVINDTDGKRLKNRR